MLGSRHGLSSTYSSERLRIPEHPPTLGMLPYGRVRPNQRTGHKEIVEVPLASVEAGYHMDIRLAALGCHGTGRDVRQSAATLGRHFNGLRTD